MTNKECLIQKFERLKNEYLKAFKSKLLGVCRKIGDELFEIAKQLRAEGMTYSDLGLSNDGEYILRSVEMVAQNPASPYADTIFADAKRLKCDKCNDKCASGEIKRTMIGVEVYEVNSDGSLSFPEPPPEPEKPPETPYLLPRRNADIQREAGEN
jgi:hypothetical protein